VLLADLDAPGKRGPFEGQQALAAFRADAQRRPLPAKQFVLGVEQRVFLEAAAVERGGAERENPVACLAGIVEPELDLALDGHPNRCLIGV
jgi:hypothetical protein